MEGSLIAALSSLLLALAAYLKSRTKATPQDVMASSRELRADLAQERLERRALQAEVDTFKRKLAQAESARLGAEKDKTALMRELFEAQAALRVLRGSVPPPGGEGGQP